MLACAGSGLAGALVPVPTKKPDSIQSTAEVLGLVPVENGDQVVALLNAPAKRLTSNPSQGGKLAPSKILTPKTVRTNVPLPPVKPELKLAKAVFRPVLTADEQIDRKPDINIKAVLATVNMDEAAKLMARLEPASFAPDTHPSDSKLPVPTNKPDYVSPNLGKMTPPAPKAVISTTHTLDPLSPEDADLYKKIFTAQGTGDWTTANTLMSQLRDQRLRGHVLSQRYMHPTYKASFAELQTWMDQYSDLPGADKVYKLASLRKTAGAGAVKDAHNQIGVSAGMLKIIANNGNAYSSNKTLSAAQERDVDQLADNVRADISRGSPSRALRRLTNDKAAKLMDDVEYDQLRSQIASGFLLMGKPDDAKALAIASANRSGAKAPLAGWTGGLAAWREKDYATAAKLFEQAAQSPYASAWMNSAGAYWASRAHMRAGHSKEVSVWLKESARHPRTFYGMIATRALGWDFDFNWSTPAFAKSDFTKLVKIPAAWRAMALVQAGQNHLAEAELLQIDSVTDPSVKGALLAYTQQVNLPSLAMRIANNTIRPDGKLYDAALYPLLPWEPKEGYTIDRALIFAIIRQESKFNTWAESASGATGLMQLMPTTASYVEGTRDFTDRAEHHTLKDPETNLDIGQKYVSQLLIQDGVNNDLLSLAIAYNAGPGNLRKWKKSLSDIDDPLLFIEMIPMAETRNYVERVMANYWIYRLRLNQPMPSLDSVAEGKWAMYDAVEDRAGATVRLGLATVANAFRVAGN